MNECDKLRNIKRKYKCSEGGDFLRNRNWRSVVTVWKREREREKKKNCQERNTIEKK